MLERSADGVTARLHLAYSGLRHAFTTRNVHVAGRVGAASTLVDGPFSLLDGTLALRAAAVPGAAGAGRPSACKIEFDLRYAFANGAARRR